MLGIERPLKCFSDERPGLQAARLTDSESDSESGEDIEDESDESWGAEHVDRQPNLRGRITDCGQVKLDIGVSGP